jgi:hypothetical protein
MNNLTYAQLERYHALISEQKKGDILIGTMAVFNACAYAFGGIKKQAFDKFLGLFAKKEKAKNPQSLKETTEALKGVGVIEIEEK